MIFLKRIRHAWHILWDALRQLSGDDAYDRYLKHHAEFHMNVVDARPALSRKEFFRLWQDAKWKGVKRCC